MLVANGEVRVSDHAYDSLSKHAMMASDAIDSIATGVVIEDYPGYHAGASVLVLQYDQLGGPLHALWGLKKGTKTPAVLVTAYRPDPARWTADFRKRKP